MTFKCKKNSYSGEIRFIRASTDNIDSIKKLDKTLFPIFYSDSFYSKLLTERGYFGFLISTNSLPVGVCTFTIVRKEAYIMTFGIIPEYRGTGIAKTSFQIMEEIFKDNDIIKITLHVSSANERAKSFYLNNNFIVDDYTDEFYTQLTPSGAFKLSKTITSPYLAKIIALNCNKED